MNNRLLLLAFAIVVAGLLHTPAFAASANPPDQMTYQGYLADGNGAALGSATPKNYDVIFRIYDSVSGGVIKWSEQQTITVDKGYFSVVLGEGSSVGSEARPALGLVFASPDASDRFIGMTVKGIGADGKDSDILPRLRLLPSAYSFLARTALTANTAQFATNALGASALVDAKGISVMNVSGNGVVVAGPVTAKAFLGMNASEIAVGTLPDARLSPNVPRLASGNLADSYLSSNVPLLNKANTFSSAPTFDAGLKLGAASYANDHHLHFRNDDFHGVGYSGTLVDGPILYGYKGGVLGAGASKTPNGVLWWNTTRVGIQTSSPQATLHVVAASTSESALRLEGNSASWDLSIDPNGYLEFVPASGKGGYINSHNGSYVSSSDARLKKDIEEIGPVMAKVMKLRPVLFRFKDATTDQKNIGFLAQELEQQFPQVVGETRGHKVVAYSDLVPVSFRAIQELQQDVEEKSKRLETLQRQVANLERMMEQLLAQHQAGCK